MGLKQSLLYRELTGEELEAIVMRHFGTNKFTAKLLDGGIVVADTNFGCGSSREHAVITLLNAGVKAVVAESFARIFYRNAINLGLPVVVCKGLSKAVEMGQEVTVDIAEGTVTLNGSGETMACDKIGEYVMNILASGGIKPMFRAKSGL